MHGISTHIETNCSVKALSTVTVSHGVDMQLIASASSEGEVKAWTMAKDGNVKENASYDSGNRLLCLVIHDTAIEQLDPFAPVSTKDDSDFSSRSEESDENEEDEWGGIQDA